MLLMILYGIVFKDRVSMPFHRTDALARVLNEVLHNFELS
jgi:hypothetical protein